MLILWTRVCCVFGWWRTCAGLQVKLVLQRNRLFVESPEKKILEKLLEDIDIQAAHEACGNAGIKTGHGRLDIAAAAIATTMQTIDLTKAPQDANGEGEGGQLPGGTKNGKQDDEDAEAEEAERSLRNAGSTNGSSKVVVRPAAAGASNVAATGRTKSQPNGVNRNSNNGNAQEGSASLEKEGRQQCAPNPVPHSNQSALPKESANMETFSFEISPLHVRPCTTSTAAVYISLLIVHVCCCSG